MDETSDMNADVSDSVYMLKDFNPLQCNEQDDVQTRYNCNLLLRVLIFYGFCLVTVWRSIG